MCVMRCPLSVFRAARTPAVFQWTQWRVRFPRLLQGNAAQLATEGDFGMQNPSSDWSGAANGEMQVEGTGGWDDYTLESAMPKDIHKELKK